MFRNDARFGSLVAVLLVSLITLRAQSGPRQFVVPSTIPFYTGGNAGGLLSDIAAGDLDGDGKPDLVVANCCGGPASGPYLSFLKGNGDGTFAPAMAIGNAVQSMPTTVELADVNGDGKLDLITSSGTEYPGAGELDVYLGNGDGTFQTPQRYLQGATVAQLGSFETAFETVIADLNGDGKPDLAVVTYVSKTLYVQPLLNKGDGTFTSGQAFTESGVTSLEGLLGAGNFHSNGKMDLLASCANNKGYCVQVLTNNGKGVFSAGPTYDIKGSVYGGPPAAHPVAILDVNHDNRPDVVLSNLQVLLGNGDGTFHGAPTIYPQTLTNGESNIVAGDFNGDGNPDFVAGPFVYLGKGDGTFTLAACYPTFGEGGGEEAATEIGVDLNGDGHLDLIWNYGSIYIGPSIEVALGSGDGSYKHPFQAPLEAIPGGGDYIDGALATGDFNRDGISDVAVGCSKGLSVPNAICVFPGSGLGYLNPVTRYNLTYEGSPAQINGGLAVGDVNGDGIPDIVATNALSYITNKYDTVVLLGKSDGTFKAPQFGLDLNTGNVGLYTLLVDINKDGKLDLVGSWGVALGNGDGTFKPAIPFPADITNVQAIVSADFNHDGFPDAAVISEPNGNSPFEITVLLGNGTGAFPKEMPLSETNSLSGLAVADLNNDGVPDLLYSVFTGQHWGLAAALGKGNGAFGTPTYSLFDTDFQFGPFGVFTGDFDRDGKVDAFITEEAHIQYFHGLGGGKFAAAQEYAISSGSQVEYVTQPNQFSILDLNGDGYPDIASADIGGLYGVIRVINTGMK